MYVFYTISSQFFIHLLINLFTVLVSTNMNLTHKPDIEWSSV